MADFTIKRNDTRPRLVTTLVDDFGTSTESALDLTTASAVKFLMRAASAAAGSAPKVNAAAAITDADAGIVTYTWAEGDTDTEGEFEGEFQITWSDDGVETIPNDTYISIQIVDDLGN